MQMRVDRLREALELLQPFIPKKTALPVTTNALLKDGSAIATDLEKCAIIGLPEAIGELLIPHKDVLELLKSVPGSEELTVLYENKQIHLSWDGGSASYDVADPKDYPPVPELKVSAEGELDGDMLVNGLLDMVPYTATKEDRPVLTGVAVSLGEKVTLAAGDGFRMGFQDLPLTFLLAQERVIDIPAATVKALGHLWKKAPSDPTGGTNLISQLTAKRKLKLSVDGDKAAFEFGRIYLILKLIEGNPPAFKNLIPQSPPNKIKVYGPDFQIAVRRVSRVAKDATSIVRLKWADSKLTVAAAAAEKGAVEVTLPAVTDDGPGKIALNVGYLTEYLAGKEDYVTMGISSDKSPILFTYRKSPDVVIMPMFVQW